jgi:hypothetical protein
MIPASFFLGKTHRAPTEVEIEIAAARARALEARQANRRPPLAADLTRRAALMLYRWSRALRGPRPVVAC